VCALGSSMMEEKLVIASMLWMSGIQCDFNSQEYSTVDEVTLYCRDRDIPWLVILKERIYQTQSIVRLKNIKEAKQEVELPKKDLIEHILRSKRSREPTSPGNLPDEALSVPASHVGQVMYPNVDIVVLYDESRGRQTRKIQLQAQQEMTRVLRSLATTTQAKIACVDLPITICREVAAMFDSMNTSNGGFTDKHTRWDKPVQQRVTQLRNCLLKWRQLPFVFIFSYRDSRHVAVCM